MISSFCARAEGDVFARIAAQVSAEGQRRIDELLAVPQEDQRSMLFHLKEYPPHGNAQTIKDYLAYYRTAIGTWEPELCMTAGGPTTAEAWHHLGSLRIQR